MPIPDQHPAWHAWLDREQWRQDPTEDAMCPCVNWSTCQRVSWMTEKTVSKRRDRGLILVTSGSSLPVSSILGDWGFLHHLMLHVRVCTFDTLTGYRARPRPAERRRMIHHINIIDTLYSVLLILDLCGKMTIMTVSTVTSEINRMMIAFPWPFCGTRVRISNYRGDSTLRTYDMSLCYYLCMINLSSSSPPPWRHCWGIITVTGYRHPCLYPLSSLL